MEITTKIVIIQRREESTYLFTFDKLLVLLVGLASFLHKFLVCQNTQISDGAASLALSNHLLQHLCNTTKCSIKNHATILITYC